jgi:formate hydrogenlyase transcriptional activator
VRICATLDRGEWKDALLVTNQLLHSQESPSARPEAQRERHRLKLLLDMTNSLVSNLEPRDLLRAISVSIRQDMHCDVVGVWLPDQERRQWRQLVMDFPEGKGVVKETAELGLFN